MRLVTIAAKADAEVRQRVGAWLDDGGVVDVGHAFARLAPRDADLLGFASGRDLTMIGLLAAGPGALAGVADLTAQAAAIGDGPLVHRAGTFRLLAPLPRPNSIRDFLMVTDHVRNSFRHVDDDRDIELIIQNMRRTPAYYKGNPDRIFGPDDDVPHPHYTERLDYELEMAAVIGRGGYHLDPDDAAACIAGFTVFNDWSARDIQIEEMKVGLGPGLGKDFANSLGPCIRTNDGFDPLNAEMSAPVDGELWSRGSVGGMLRSFPELISWISQAQEVRAGDVIGSGTIANGCGQEQGRFLSVGSVVELEVDGIGILRNTVVAPDDGGTLS